MNAEDMQLLMDLSFIALGFCAGWLLGHREGGRSMAYFIARKPEIIREIIEAYRGEKDAP